MLRKKSKRLAIVDGPEVARVAEEVQRLKGEGFLEVEVGPCPGVKDNYARLFLEAMMPAVMGAKDVVLNRSWLYEILDAELCGRKSRITGAEARMLHRLAMRCELTMHIVKDDLTRLGGLFESCQKEHYPEGPYKPHGLGQLSVGNLGAPILLIVEDFEPLSNRDSLWQFPGISFLEGSSSKRLTINLLKAKIPEHKLCWLPLQDYNKTFLESFITTGGCHGIVCLGNVVRQALPQQLPCPVFTSEHPLTMSEKSSHLIELLGEINV